MSSLDVEVVVTDLEVTVVSVLPTGPRGPAGPAGADGADGSPGADGDSAYEVAVAEGFIGDEAAWLASLVGPQGDPGEGVPVGGTTGQVLAKATATDFDTEWVDQTGGGGSGIVETIVAGTNIDVDATDPANPIVSLETLVDADIPSSIARDSEVTAAVAAEATLARNADNLTSGTVADARIASTIARDSEVTAAISASEAGQVRDGDAAGGVLSGTYPNPGFAADMATQAELDAHINDASDAHDASAISSVPAGTLAATDVQTALNELDTEKATTGSVSTVASDLAAHLADTSDAHDASAISIADAGNDFTATDVEGALAELQADHEADATALSDHIADTTAAHAATAISFTPAGTIAATTVQAAIEEVASEAGGGSGPDVYVFDGTDYEPVTRVFFGSADPTSEGFTGTDGDGWVTPGAGVDTVVAGAGISVDSTDPANPVVTAEVTQTELDAKAPLASPALTGNPTAPTATQGDNDTSIATTAFVNAEIAADAYTPGGTDVAVADGGTGASTAAGARTNLDVPSNSEAILDTIVDAKGDLLTATAADTPARLAAGTNGHVLVADSAQSTGLKWAGSNEVLVFALTAESGTVVTGNGIITFRMPFAMTLSDVRASLKTASSSGTPTFDINEGGTTILSTKITIDANEKTSTTAATPPVISDSALADDAEITIDVDVAGTGAQGAKVYLIGTRA